MSVIKIIVGSTRPGRFGIQVGSWLKSVGDEIAAAAGGQVKFEVVDLAEINLPMYDEPIPASMRKYQNEHTKKWSAIVEEADGFVMVTPEYNNSFNAALKNALDYVYQEWNFKPVTFASYGSGAGGSRAVAHLRDVVGEMKMFDLRESVLISNYWNGLGQDGAYQFSEEQKKGAAAMLQQLAYWAGAMKPAREKLASS
jgi:NAD(P)H-dependent FMN reductase